MKIKKTVDEKLADIGFVKVNENKYGVDYERKDGKFNYTQVVSIGHKRSGRHILQSYDKDMKDEYGVGNTCVGLTGYEIIFEENETNRIVQQDVTKED